MPYRSQRVIAACTCLALLLSLSLVSVGARIAKGERKDSDIYKLPNLTPKDLEWSNRLKTFYAMLADPAKKVQSCSDGTKLLPECVQCIPGTQLNKATSSCTDFIPSSQSIREEIRKLTIERYPTNRFADREFGLYPYLEHPDFLFRQVLFGRMLAQKNIKNLMDIGAYYNPINLFLDSGACPESIIVIEPILDPLSVFIPCANTSASAGANTKTHIMFLPITFKYYMDTSRALLPGPEYVVCIGCDSHYGPNRKMLENSFKRPYNLYLEYPSEYVHNGPFRKMGMSNEDVNADQMTFHHKFQPKTNATKYTRRVMKVIEYEAQ